MSYYEAVFVTRQDFTPNQVEDLSKEFEKVITGEKGKVTKKENWGLRQLAYKINKNKKGYYVLFQIDGPAASIQELDRKLRLDENVIRHLIVRIEALTKDASPIMSQRENSKVDIDE